ncbi:DUF6907 domain-containing protein [Streptomyces sp. B21-083]|uniref:DUF6907 domain-containing protein n=1 Tax=Streptomyces sp. B21-083 TaxID=3039410 RepID=UPI002FF27AB4
MTSVDNTFAGLAITTAVVKGIQVPIACPTGWCNNDHTDENTQNLDDIDHAGAHIDLMVPNLQGVDDLLFAYARLYQDTYAPDPLMRTPHIRIEFGGGEESYLTPDQADLFAARLAAFAAQLQALAHTARNPGTAGSTEATGC